MKYNVGIFIFNNAEVLDFAGPFEVFSVTTDTGENKLFNVFTIGATEQPISAVNGLLVTPNYSFANHPPVDILILSGGQGTRDILKITPVLKWIYIAYSKSKLVLSICSASRILALLGLLDNRPFCTHQQVYSHMSEIAPTAIPCSENRFIKSDEKIYTSGGISAGIDLSFHIVEKLFGKEVATQTALYMEYKGYSPN